MSLQVPAEFGFDYPQHGWHVEWGPPIDQGGQPATRPGKHTKSYGNLP